MMELLGEKIWKPVAKKGTTEAASTYSKLCHLSSCTAAVLSWVTERADEGKSTEVIFLVVKKRLGRVLDKIAFGK